MARTDWHGRVTVQSDIHHGDPCIAGTRVPVATIVGSLADGLAEHEVLSADPQLTPADVRVALAYAADVLIDWARTRGEKATKQPGCTVLS